MSTGLNCKLDLWSAQGLASCDTRYGKICRVMRAFCGALKRMTLGRTDVHSVFTEGKGHGRALESDTLSRDRVHTLDCV